MRLINKSLNRALNVSFAVVSTGLCLAVLTEPASAKEKPLYVGDFGARYSFTYHEFRMPIDADAVLRDSRLQKSYSLPATQLPTAGFGVRSYRSFSQLMKPPRTLHLPSDYTPAVSLPCFSYITGSERASAGDFWPRSDRYTSVIRPGASNLFQPVSAMKFPSRNFDVIHNFHLLKYPAAAQRFDSNSNIRKREPASSSSH
ncbi:MAG: hypothetical protein QG574_5477 [Cyanobacteriota bacterium erpe_2018_sw_21hr_WHONDRS-SW48-000092_B_bin.40]|jgi:hypothetical protein|nr:hypothetical protein [Cyanobacteriota bacterium erpe_2018_sw_21hr_WHONDRS-SW48-000092_B_bin.40]